MEKSNCMLSLNGGGNLNNELEIEFESTRTLRKRKL